MADSKDQNNEDVSSLGMSDEDFLKAPPPAPVTTSQESDEEEVEAEEEEAKEDTESEKAEDDEEDSEESSDSDDSKESDESDVADENKEPKKEDESKDKDPKADKKPAEKDVKPKTEETPSVNYEAEYKRLMAPFKANGREIQAKSVDDAISLMQMGANYNKRMAALKPNLKLMRMLENNNLLDEGKLNFLIDLDKRNPEAINKLVKDSGIDPMDLSTEKAEAYKQSTYNVDDREIELDTVIDELKDSPTYNRTLEIVSTKWDSASKQTIAQHPQILKLIDSHVDSGIYDIINAEVENERLFGRLKGVSDIEAYRQVGDAIQARGGFNHLNKGSSQDQGQPAPKPVVVQPKPKQVDDDKLKDKRRAASSTKPAAPASKGKEYDPLSMSDEEFMKLAANKYS